MLLLLQFLTIIDSDILTQLTTEKHKLRYMYLINSKSLAFLLSFFSFVTTGFSQTARFSSEKYIANGDTLLYRQLYPDSDTMRKYPLVIFLHGSGERGRDNEA